MAQEQGPHRLREEAEEEEEEGTRAHNRKAAARWLLCDAVFRDTVEFRACGFSEERWRIREASAVFKTPLKR